MTDEFGFRIDGDYVNINQDYIGDFIDMLDSQFESWGKKELTGTGKIEDIKIEKVVGKKVLEQEERAIRAKEIITFRGAQIPKTKITTERILEVLSKEEWQAITHLIFKLKI